MNNKDQEDLDYLKRNFPCCVKAMNELAELRAENEQLKARLIDLQRALGNEFQDPPECGQVTEGAQIHRMKRELANSRAECDRLKADISSWQTVTNYARGGGAMDSGPGDLQALIEGLWKQIADLKTQLAKRQSE